MPTRAAHAHSRTLSRGCVGGRAARRGALRLCCRETAGSAHEGVAPQGERGQRTKARGRWMGSPAKALHALQIALHGAGSQNGGWRPAVARRGNRRARGAGREVRGCRVAGTSGSPSSRSFGGAANRPIRSERFTPTDSRREALCDLRQRAHAERTCAVVARVSAGVSETCSDGSFAAGAERWLTRGKGENACTSTPTIVPKGSEILAEKGPSGTIQQHLRLQRWLKTSTRSKAHLKSVEHGC
eukprot:363934-Chlamydomonas_euryale.AAC.3